MGRPKPPQPPLLLWDYRLQHPPLNTMRKSMHVRHTASLNVIESSDNLMARAHAPHLEAESKLVQAQ